MEVVHDEQYVVFVRHDLCHGTRPDYAERPLFQCSTYAEARRVQRELLRTNCECVIRHVGQTGGGD
jgi:hypothetical protein